MKKLNLDKLHILIILIPLVPYSIGAFIYWYFIPEKIHTMYYMIIYLSSLPMLFGLFTIFLGYIFTFIFGGIISPFMISHFSKLTGSYQIIEFKDNNSITMKYRIFVYTTFIILIFLLSMFFSINLEVIRLGLSNYGIQIIQVFSESLLEISPHKIIFQLLGLTFLMSMLSSAILLIVFPYFLNLRLIGINATPFPRFWLLAMFGIAGGYSIFISLSEIIELSIDRGQWAYLILVLLGYSINSLIGAHIALRPTLNRIKATTDRFGLSNRFFKGKITITKE